MYKILVADDEPIAVESVRFMIQKYFGEQFQIETCSSGKQAVELAYTFHPDLVIMDVDMPGISGIEAIKQIKEQNNAVEFVILSAYDYFDYAQEAVKLGATDYLLKPFNEEHFKEVLRQIFAKMDTQQASKQSILAQQEKWLMSIPVLENSFLSALSQLGNYDTADLESACKLLGHKDVGGYVIILSRCTGVPCECGDEDYEAYCHMLKRAYRCIVGAKKDCIIAYVFDEDGSLFPETAAALSKVLERAGESGVQMAAGVGGRYDTLSDARRSYQEARSAVNIAKQKQSGKEKHEVLFMEQYLKEIISSETLDAHCIEEKMCAFMEDEDPVAAVHEFDLYMDRVKRGEETFRSARNKTADIWISLGRRLGIPAEDARADLDRILKSETIEALLDAVRDTVVRTATTLEFRKRRKAINIVEQAEAYILKHYAEAITLDDVAQSVNLSQHYFSRFFKHEKGIGFADHLAKVRIDHAIELLLMDELSVKEIAYMVGFNDPNYFSKAFKKATGFRPGDYKKSVEEAEK